MLVPRGAPEEEEEDPVPVPEDVDVPLEKEDEEEVMGPPLDEGDSFCLLLLGLVLEAVIALALEGALLDPGLNAPDDPGGTNCCCP